jgi:hypothetical protein
MQGSTLGIDDGLDGGYTADGSSNWFPKKWDEHDVAVLAATQSSFGVTTCRISLTYKATITVK